MTCCTLSGAAFPRHRGGDQLRHREVDREVDAAAGGQSPKACLPPSLGTRCPGTSPRRAVRLLRMGEGCQPEDSGCLRLGWEPEPPGPGDVTQQLRAPALGTRQGQVRWESVMASSCPFGNAGDETPGPRANPGRAPCSATPGSPHGPVSGEGSWEGAGQAPREGWQPADTMRHALWAGWRFIEVPLGARPPCRVGYLLGDLVSAATPPGG